MAKSIVDYECEYLSNYGFEEEMVRYRAKLVVSRLVGHAPRHVLEVGCGVNLQAKEWQDAGGTWDNWIVVEPSLAFCEKAREAKLPNFTVVNGFLEDLVSQLGGLHAPDMILCSSLLHEVPDSRRLLRTIRELMRPATLLHVNVPNATSMHRRLARAMGLISDLRDLSERNKALQQLRVFEADTLAEQFRGLGLIVEHTGGYFVKPFTHTQMASLTESVSRDVLDGLYRLGVEMPELASEIFVEARLA